MNFLHTKLGGMRNDYLDEFLFLSNNLLNEKNRLTQGNFDLIQINNLYYINMKNVNEKLK